jgi:hypothetical protein
MLNGLSNNTSCGKEALQQVSEIQRFRWGNGMGTVAGISDTNTYYSYWLSNIDKRAKI